MNIYHVDEFTHGTLCKTRFDCPPREHYISLRIARDHFLAPKRFKYIMTPYFSYGNASDRLTSLIHNAEFPFRRDRGFVADRGGIPAQ